MWPSKRIIGNLFWLLFFTFVVCLIHIFPSQWRNTSDKKLWKVSCISQLEADQTRRNQMGIGIHLLLYKLIFHFIFCLSSILKVVDPSNLKQRNILKVHFFQLTLVADYFIFYCSSFNWNNLFNKRSQS